MTTLYRPVKITSAEQAEALPIGTVAHDRDHETDPDLIPYVKITPKLWVSVWDVDEDHEIGAYGVCPNSHIVGDTALVPIEAEEEIKGAPDLPPPNRYARYATPWMETP